MKNSDKTLIEQLKFTKKEIERRKEYLDLTENDRQTLLSLREIVGDNIEEIVENFYEKILPFREMDRVIGDAETLRRLKNHQRGYILSLFDGQYDEDYVHSRLRVGVVHKRIGVHPKFYVSAMYNLSSILRSIIINDNKSTSNNCSICEGNLAAIEKIVMFDLSLAFDTYIYSLMDDVKRSEEELEDYTTSLEEVISERTKLLRQQARHDGLTNLLNQHSFYTELKRELLRAQRRGTGTALIYFDLDGFKKLNDTEGHQRGDEILVAVAKGMRETLRETDILARYGGDEFCVILPDCGTEQAQHVCKKLCTAMIEATKNSEVTCSLGIAMAMHDENCDANTLVKAADSAMYEAKKEPGFVIKTAPLAPSLRSINPVH